MPEVLQRGHVGVGSAGQSLHASRDRLGGAPGRGGRFAASALPVGAFGETIASSSHSQRSRTGSRLGEKKAEKRIDADYLDWALDDFSGYIAADELYDGPYCVLSIVDNRTFKRIVYKVLDHDPTHDDIREFFTGFKDALHARSLTLKGITTDGSALYPLPIADVPSAPTPARCRIRSASSTC